MPGGPCALLLAALGEKRSANNNGASRQSAHHDASEGLAPDERLADRRDIRARLPEGVPGDADAQLVRDDLRWRARVPETRHEELGGRHLNKFAQIFILPSKLAHVTPPAARWLSKRPRVRRYCRYSDKMKRFRLRG